MSDQKHEEKVLNNLMKQSLIKIPFADFEDRLMDKIYQEEHQQKSISGNIRVAWIFFFLGLFLGLLITSMTSNMSNLIQGIPVKEIAFILQIGIVVVLLFQFDKLLGYSLKNKTRKQ